MRAILLALIGVYQYLFRPLLGSHCRFAPSCSDYATRSDRETRRRARHCCSRCAGSRAVTRIIRAGMTRYPNPPATKRCSEPGNAGRRPLGRHGHATPHPLFRLLLLRFPVVAALGCRASSARAGHDRGRAQAAPARRADRSARRRRPRRRRSAARRRRAAGAAAAAKAGEIITVTTDLYRADIDTAGGIIAQVALARASRHRRRGEALPRAAAHARAHLRRRVRAPRRRHAEPPHRCTRRCPVRATLAPGADRLEVKLQATAANGDKVIETLTFHRDSYVIDVSYEITNAGHDADRAVRVFPARCATPRRRARTTRWRRPRTRAR